jgi:hypothetical protein
VLVWGVSTLAAGVVLGILRSSGADPVAEAITEQPSWQDAIVAVYHNVTELLRLAANAMVLVGVLAVAGAWYVGSSRSAVATRDVTVPTMRRHPVATWVGLAVVAYLAFTRVPALESRQALGTLILLVLLAVGFAAIQREALRLTPADAPAGPARSVLGTLRARVVDAVSSERSASPETMVAAANAEAAALSTAEPDLLQRLERLDDLHRRSVLDDEEFATAKRMLLGEGVASRQQPRVAGPAEGGTDGTSPA